MTRERSILITGCTRGIGRALCEARLARGDRVVGVSRTSPEAPLTGAFEHVAIDLSETKTLDRQLHRLFDKSPPFDAIVSNAGAAALGSIEQFNAKAIERALALNLQSHMLLARHAVPRLARGAHLVFVGSEAAHKPGRRGSVYCAAKAGLAGFAAALREELSGRGIHVGIVHPGMTRTSFHDDQEVEPGPEEDHALRPNDVARGISHVLDAPDGVVVEELRMRPRKHVLKFRR